MTSVEPLGLASEPASSDPPRFALARPGERYERHPGDLLRLVLWTAGTVALVALVETADRTAAAVDADLSGWIESIPEVARQLARTLVAVTALAVPLALVAVLALLRRWRRLVTLAGTAALAATAYVAVAAVAGLTAVVVVDDADVPAWAARASPAGLAAAVAAATVARPWSSRSWRRAVWWLLVGLATTMLAGSLVGAVQVLLAVAVGHVVAAVVLVGVGAPNRRPSPADVAAGLAGAGIQVVDLCLLRAVAGRAQLYRASTVGGDRLIVKVYDDDTRDADVLYRAGRSLLVRAPSALAMNATTATTAKERAEHELLVLYAGAAAVLRVPPAHGSAAVPGGSTAVAMGDLGGTPLDELDPAQLDVADLAAVWQEVGRLHDAGLAHNALRVQNVLATDRGPAFVGLAGGDVTAERRSQLLDRAELLASMTGLVGREAAVSSARAVLAAGDLADVVPYLQPLALSRRTRAAVSRRDLERLREHVAEATNTEVEPLVRLARVRPRTLVTVIALTGAFYLLLPQLANVDDTVAAVRSADWAWVAAAVLLSAASYLFAAIGLMSGVSAPLPLLRTVQAQVASSFVNRVTPANVGGMALNVRFMQRAGAGSAEAVTATGLNVIAGAVVHVGLLVVFVSWAGQQPGTSFSLPASSTTLVVIVVLLALLGVVAATRRGRRLLHGHVIVHVKRSLASILVVLRSPARLVGLLGGSLGVTASYGVAFGCAVQAFGGGVGIPEIGAVYLGAAALAAVAPTPGGLGAMEAALVAGLTAAGQDPSLALASVLTFRLATFWLPILPGWLAFRQLERHQYV